MDDPKRFSFPRLKFITATIDPEDGSYKMEERSLWWFLDYKGKQVLLQYIFYILLATVFFHVIPMIVPFVLTGKTALELVGVLAITGQLFSATSGKEALQGSIAPVLFLLAAICL